MKKLFLSMYDTYVIYHGYEFKYSESTGSHPAISYRKVHHTYDEKMNRLLPLKKQHPIDLLIRLLLVYHQQMHTGLMSDHQRGS